MMNTEKIFMGLLILLLSIMTVSAVDIYSCGSYNESNTVYNLTQNLEFTQSSLYNPCIALLDIENVTFNGNGYTIKNNYTLNSGGRGIIIDQNKNVTIHDINFENVVIGIASTVNNNGVNGRVMNCSNRDIEIYNINLNSSFNSVLFSCDLIDTNTTIGTTLFSPQYYSHNINIRDISIKDYNKTSAVSSSHLYIGGVNNLTISNINFTNLASSTSRDSTIFINRVSNATIEDIDVNRVFSNVVININTNTSNIIVSGVESHYCCSQGIFKSSISPLENILIENVNHSDGYNTTLGTIIGSIFGSSNTNYPKNFTVRNIVATNIDGNGNFISTFGNSENALWENITINNATTRTVSSFISVTDTATVLNPSRSITFKNIYFNNVSKNLGAFISIRRQNTTLDNIQVNGLSLQNTDNASILLAQTMFRFFPQIANTNIDEVKMLNINIPEISNINNTIGIMIQNVSQIYFENVSNLQGYYPQNNSCSISPCTPFYINGTTTLNTINVDSKYNLGWFPKNYTVTTNTQYEDLALYNLTNDLLINTSTTPFTYYSTNYYRIFNNDIGIGTCTEDWISNDTSCNGINYTIQYYDANSCGTNTTIPIDNGLVVSCSYPLTGLVAYNQQVTQDLNNVLIPITIILLVIGVVLTLINLYTTNDQEYIKYAYIIVAGIFGVVLIILVIVILLNPLSLIT